MCLGWSQQASEEYPLGNGRQPPGPRATENTAWYHQHHGTMTKTGSERGQIRGNHMRLEQDCVCIRPCCLDNTPSVSFLARASICSMEWAALHS